MSRIYIYIAPVGTASDISVEMGQKSKENQVEIYYINALQP